MKESLSLRFLYNTAFGRAVLKALVRPRVSRVAGRFLDTRASCFLIKPFARKNAITTDGIDVPEGGFPSFNAFFTRRRTEVVFPGEPSVLASPCDGFLTLLRIDEDCVFRVKHTEYSLASLLGSEAEAERYADGYAFIYRLAPANYHRYHHVDNGTVVCRRTIPGELHTVRPIATESLPVYIRNSREYVVCESENFGRYVQMEVGALLVGRINNFSAADTFTRGEEKGCFEYGGSTIIMLFEHGKVIPEPSVQKASALGRELIVTLGDPVGEKI